MPRPACDQIIPPALNPPMPDACAHHMAVDSRLPSHDAPAMPCPCRALSWPCLPWSARAQPLLPLCSYKRATPSPCSHAPEYHHHPAISATLNLTVEPHFPLLHPNQGSKRVALNLLVLPYFPTLPPLTGPPPSCWSSCSPVAAQLRQPQPQPSTPTDFPRLLVLPHLFLLAFDQFPRWILARNSPPPPRDYIAITNSF
jgi:hypothetical protein